MEQLEDGFVPDFEHVASGGEVTDRRSMVRQAGGVVYISVGSKLCGWNVRFSEVERRIATVGKRITDFECSAGMVVVGYENGAVQIHSSSVTSFRPHSRRVARVARVGDYVLSGSADGSVALYDVVGGEVKVWYEGNDACVEGLFGNEQIVVAACGDSAVRVWDFGDKHLKSTHVFEKEVRDVVGVGPEVMVVFKDGECILYDVEERARRPFNMFKKLRNVKARDGRMFFQTKSKLHVYGVEGGGRAVLRHVETRDVSDRYVDFDVMEGSGLVFAAADNCWEWMDGDKVYSFGHHRSEILGVEMCGDRMVTLSRESVFFWMSDGGEVRRVGGIRIKDGRCMCVWSGGIAVGGQGGVSCYSALSHDSVWSEDVGAVSCMCTSGRELLVGRDRTVLFYDERHICSRTLDLEEPVSAMAMARDGSFVCVGLLNSKVHIYEMDGLKQRVSLYGHSLPVRWIAVSPDGLEVLTCGADKVVKMWGTQFGECRKSFVGDAWGVEYLNKELFMFASGRAQYFRRYEKLKEFKDREARFVLVRGDTMVSCGRFNIDVYVMGKYELEKEDQEESESSEVMRVARVMNSGVYDRFLCGLEHLPPGVSGEGAREFFDVLMDIDFCELDRFMCLLSSSDIGRLLEVLHECAAWNAVLVARVFISLVRLHKDVCISHPKFGAILRDVTGRVAGIRTRTGMNEGELLVRRCAREQAGVTDLE